MPTGLSVTGQMCPVSRLGSREFPPVLMWCRQTWGDAMISPVPSAEVPGRSSGGGRARGGNCGWSPLVMAVVLVGWPRRWVDRWHFGLGRRADDLSAGYAIAFWFFGYLWFGL